MTQEEKQLLFKDLCARLPYGVILYDEYCKKDYKLKSLDTNCFVNYNIANSITHIKPYLRPMSSMTKDERMEYFLLSHREFDRDDNIIDIDEADELITWLYKHHLDFHKLIWKGLALEAPEGMYKIG